MSLASTVAQLVTERGSATVDELLSDLTAYTRKQLLDAFKNARNERLIHCLGIVRVKGVTIHNVSAPARHYPGPKPGTQQSERVIYTRPPNSAWELAQGRQIAGSWPPAGEGRRFHPLGGWNEEA